MVGRNEHHSRILVQREQHRQRSHRAATPDITAEAVSLMRKTPRQTGITIPLTQLIKSVCCWRVLWARKLKGALQRVDIEQRLSRVLVGPGTRIHYGYTPLASRIQVVHQICT